LEKKKALCSGVVSSTCCCFAIREWSRQT
jgi:hypothetical protein